MDNTKDLNQLAEDAENAPHLNREPIEITIYQASQEFQETTEAIRKGLRRDGVTVLAGWTYTLREIYVALAGDFTFERTRVEREKADALIRDRKKEEGELVEWERVMQILTQWLKLPTINSLDNAPNDEAREWIEKSLKPIWIKQMDEMKKQIVEDYLREKK